MIRPKLAGIVPSSAQAPGARGADNRFRDWVSIAISYYYHTGQTQVWYEEFLSGFGVDPDTVPPIRREEW